MCLKRQTSWGYSALQVAEEDKEESEEELVFTECNSEVSEDVYTEEEEEDEEDAIFTLTVTLAGSST